MQALISVTVIKTAYFYDYPSTTKIFIPPLLDINKWHMLICDAKICSTNKLGIWALVHWGWKAVHEYPFWSPDATILLVNTENRNLWVGPTPEVCDSWTSRQISQIWLAEKTKQILCVSSEKWVLTEFAILGADRKDCSLWGWEWCVSRPLAMI